MMHANSSIPVLHTARLVLRPHRLDDFEQCCALWTEPAVTRFIGGRPSTREEVWARLLRYAGLWKLVGYGFWVIEDRVTGSYVGEAGLMEAKREIAPSMEGIPEAGWSLFPHAQGKGVASEAVQAALAWADQALVHKETTCIISPENVASLRVAEKQGYCEHARSIYKGDQVIQFRRQAVAGLAS